MSWIRQVFTMELRKILTYRFDFWVQFIGQTIFSFVIAYFLWQSIFISNQVASLQGYTMEKMILYYLMVPLIFRVQQGATIGIISREIYEGELTKYLLYPVNYYLFKIVSYMAHSFFYTIQLFVILALYRFVMGDQSIYQLTLWQLPAFIVAMSCISLTFFALNSISELIAFWADNIWSLGVILRFFTSFLGGGMIPLAFFPQAAQDLLNFTPFPYMISFPMSILFNEVTLNQYMSSMSIIIAWLIIFFMISQLLWRKGQYKYTGVGI